MTNAEKLIRLCRELDIEMDGVACPGSAAAILNAIRSIVSDVEDHEIHAEEQSRWQDAIYQRLRQVAGDAIDGGGCDSGDPLDVTLCEIGQAIEILTQSRRAD